MDKTPSQKNAEDLVSRLTPRETEVLRLVAHGRTNDEIAGSLMISKRTVNTHINTILKKLRLTNRAQMVLYALNSGLISLDN
jgi:DNA-binding NarL/FixJ family response regulator